MEPSSPPVLAFYDAWFDENTWTSGQAADTPSLPYRSADPATIERHVSQAADAGISAFVQSWYGPQVENNQTESNFRLLLDAAVQRSFQAAVDVEVMGPLFPDRASVQAALATLMATHIHHPAYLRYQGKPVIFFWRQGRFSPAEWAAIRGAVDPNHTTTWIAEGVDLSYQDVFDGHHLYSIAWAADPQAELKKWPSRIQKIEDSLGADRLWVATVMPGYNDLNLGRTDSFARPRNNGDFYRQSWQAAQAANPDMVIITSYNEWLEGTQIEPSATYGEFYLDLTRQLINSSKGAPAPPKNNLVGQIADLSVTANEKEISGQVSGQVSNLSYSKENGIYLIRPGDTLYTIAFAFDVPLVAILTANNLDVSNILSIGQALVIPDVGEQTNSSPSPNISAKTRNIPQ